MTNFERLNLCILILILAVAFIYSGESKADSNAHQVFIGFSISHMSNVDRGVPFDNLHEDNADHVGVDVEYQYHPNKEGDYAFFSFGVGKSRHKTREGSGWDCSDCKFPSMMRAGYKWRIK